MKKILILQIKDERNGGVWFVNKTLAKELLKKEFMVKILSIRGPFISEKDDCNIDITTINNTDKWEIVHKKDILINLKKGIFQGIKTFFKWINDNKKLNYDYKRMKKFINNYAPDYLIASHYQVLPGVPKKYLKKTINVHHTSYDMLNIFKDNKKKLLKLKNKLTFIWLTKNSLNKAINDGFKNSYYIYNMVKFETEKCTNLSNNKLITITRLGEEKRIPLMIDIVNDVFKNNEFKNWTFDIYGYGPLEDKIRAMIEGNDRINFKGSIGESKDVLLGSSIYLCTSKFEGFSVSILEAYECGVPIITFNFGESCFEEVLNNKTGFIIEQGDISGYKEKLEELMKNKDKLKEMSIEAKKYSLNFHKNKIIDEWLKLFEKIDMKG